MASSHTTRATTRKSAQGKDAPAETESKDAQTAQTPAEDPK